LNLDFERVERGQPYGWNISGNSNYTVSIDSLHVKNGKLAGVIQYQEGNGSFGAWTFVLPNNYAGKKITLSGYIKTENVSDGYAGLWMRIDPLIAFDNMNSNGVKGTSDWQKYEITLDMKPENTERIVVGGLLVGKGKMWIDDLKLTIDGKDVNDLTPYQRKLLPAELDKEFNKGSKVDTIIPDAKTVENLRVLGLIWGYLKYYHPNVAKGDYNWDFELFRILPKILSSKSVLERDKVLITWIYSLGTFENGKQANTFHYDIKTEPDLGWIQKSGFSQQLTSLLLNIQTAELTGNHFYIGLHPGVGNPNFTNEQAYPSLTYPDAGFRLLALYRYWNMIQYYFPYKNLIGEDWKGVLKEFLPKFLNAKNEQEYTLNALELVGRIHDTHAKVGDNNQVLLKYFGRYFTAVEVSFINNKAVVTGFYDDTLGKETGLCIGDVITKVNNQTIEDIIKERLKLTPASNYPTKLRDIARDLLRTNDTTIQIEVNREGKPASKIIKAYYDREFNVNRKFFVQDTCFRKIGQDIGYINNSSIKKAYLPKLSSEIQKTKCLIIDNRNYPSDFVIYELSNYLMPKEIPFVRFTNGSIVTPGLFTYSEPVNAGTKNDQSYKGKVVILVNEFSQSSSEFHAMAYRAFPNAVVIGSTTAGADGNVSPIVLPGGIHTMISGIGVYYPDGRETQRVGIVPDIEVKPTLEGIKNGRDEVLEKAVNYLGRYL
jgi:C-terminal processing protease CtpA/Prc